MECDLRDSRQQRLSNFWAQLNFQFQASTMIGLNLNLVIFEFASYRASSRGHGLLMGRDKLDLKADFNWTKHAIETFIEVASYHCFSVSCMA